MADSFEFTHLNLIDDSLGINHNFFYLLRSDYGIELLRDKIESYLKEIGFYLKKYLNILAEEPDESEENCDMRFVPPDVIEILLCYVCALFVFGHFRLYGNSKSKIVDDAIAFLLDHQQKNGCWAGFSDFSISSRELTCLAIHALSSKKAFGWKVPCKLASMWLIENEKQMPLYVAKIAEEVMLLDALDMSEGKTDLTFSLVNKSKKEPQTKMKPVNKINRNDYSKWNTPCESCFIIDGKNRLLFDLNGQEKDLNVGHKSRAYKLMTLFADQEDGVTSCLVKSYVCSDKTKPNHLVRDVNTVLVLKLRSKFPILPESMKIIAYNKRAMVYITLVPVKSIDRYNRNYIQDMDRANYQPDDKNTDKDYDDENEFDR